MKRTAFTFVTIFVSILASFGPAVHAQEATPARDISLRECVEIALRSNINIAVSQTKKEIRQAGITIEEAAFLPMFTTLSLTLLNLRQETNSADALLSPQYVSGLTFSVEQPLLKNRGRQVTEAPTSSRKNRSVRKKPHTARYPAACFFCAITCSRFFWTTGSMMSPQFTHRHA
jgi:outer membrane protein TolC